MQLLRPAALALSAAVLLAGCSGSDDEPEAAGTTEAAEATDATETADSPTADDPTQAEGTPAKQKRNEPWAIDAGEPMTDRQVNYLAVCVQWDGYQDGVRWHEGIWENAYDSGNKLALDRVERVSREITEDGEPSEETAELMDELCEDIDR